MEEKTQLCEQTDERQVPLMPASSVILGTLHSVGGSISLHSPMWRHRLCFSLDSLSLFARGAENTDTGLPLRRPVKDREKQTAHSIRGLRVREISRTQNKTGTRKLFCPFASVA